MSRNADQSDQPTRTRAGALASSAESTFARPGTPQSLAPGEIFGSHRIIRLLGKGGMGEAYEAEHVATGRRLALKILTDPDPSPEASERFLREGRSAANLNHPNSVYVFGTEEVAGRWAIMMELVGGGTLKDRVLERGPLPSREAVDLILQVVDGLEAAAAAGILHRDIKPANCFVELDGTAKIGDFGLSLSTLARERSKNQLTGSGTFLGTPAFASPEQLRGADIDVRSDIYSLGATMYYVLVGHPPFENGNLMELLTTIAAVKPTPPHRLRPGIPRDLSSLVVRCLAKAPQGRPESYARLRQELQVFGTPRASMHLGGLSLISGTLDALIVALTMRATAPWPDIAQYVRLAAGLTLVLLPIVIWRRSIGDRIVRVRIADRSGAPPPTYQVLLGGIGAVWAAAGAMTPQIAFGSVGPLIFLAVWAGIVRSGFFDLLFRVRRVSASSSSPRPQLLSLPTTDARGRTTLGPYIVVTDKITPGFDLGYDEVLLRHVWIQYSPSDRPVPPERLHVRRPTRLRWLNGGSHISGAWNAYEAPRGEALSKRERPMEWPTAHKVILDLARELEAGQLDGTLPEHIGLDSVWVDDLGSVKLVDAIDNDLVSKVRSYGTSDERARLAFLGDVLERLVTDRQGAVMLPRNVRCLRAELRMGTFHSVKEALPMLTVLARGPIHPRFAAVQSFTFMIFFGALFVFSQGAVTVGVGSTELRPPTSEPQLPSWFAPWDGIAVALLSACLVYAMFVVRTASRFLTERGSALSPARLLSAGGDHEIVGVDGGPTSRVRAVLRDVLVILPVGALCLASLRDASGVWLVPIAVAGLGLLLALWRGRDPLGWLTGTRLVPTHRPFGDGAADRSSSYEVIREVLERPEFDGFDGQSEAAWTRLEIAVNKRPLFGIKWFR